MGRCGRGDSGDQWHHVMNRGIARRTVFEGSVDIRMFLARLAGAVRAGRIEVHAYCVLSTHFHLLLRSPRGELSEAMQEVLNDYVRWFNRGRRRDGSLFRGRFRSKPVDSLEYREELVRYIDANAVQARVVRRSEEYPFGSAWWYARERSPRWLSRAWVESTVVEILGAPTYEPWMYSQVFGQEGSAARSLRLSNRGCNLLASAPAPVLAWMQRKALTADGTPIGLPVRDVGALMGFLAEARASRGVWRLPVSRRSVDAWSQVSVGLLRDLCGAQWVQIGALVEMSPFGASKAYARHRHWLAADAPYAQAVAELVEAALAAEDRRP